MTDQEFEAALPKGIHNSFRRAQARANREKAIAARQLYGEAAATDEEILAAIRR